MANQVAEKKMTRGILKKAAKAGKLYIRCKFRYTDDYAFDNAVKFGKQEDFSKVYLFEELDTEESRQLDAAIEEAYKVRGHNSPEFNEMVERLRRLRREHSSRLEAENPGAIRKTSQDFAYKTGAVWGNRETGEWQVYQNLVFEYKIVK